MKKDVGDFINTHPAIGNRLAGSGLEYVTDYNKDYEQLRIGKYGQPGAKLIPDLVVRWRSADGERVSQGRSRR